MNSKNIKRVQILKNQDELNTHCLNTTCPPSYHRNSFKASSKWCNWEHPYRVEWCWHLRIQCEINKHIQGAQISTNSTSIFSGNDCFNYWMPVTHNHIWVCPNAFIAMKSLWWWTGEHFLYQGCACTLRSFSFIEKWTYCAFLESNMRMY